MKSADVVVPLAWQIANPPFAFVGRAEESRRLATVLARAPVAILWGFSGAGKSALLSSVLAARFPEARPRTLVVDAQEGDVVARALRRVTGIAGVLAQSAARGDESEAQAARDAAELVEALERAGLWLVVENLERVEAAPGLASVLATAQRHARHARIVCLCREDPRIALLAPQTLQVALLQDADLRALLDEVQAGLPDAEAAGIVRRAAGSPWRLLQLSLGGSDDDAGPEASLLALSPIALGLLRTLALLSTSVPKETLAKAVRMPDPTTLEMLARRGYVEASPRGLRVHDAARPFVHGVEEDDARAVRARKLLRAVAETDDVDLCASIIGLAHETRDEEALLALLQHHGEALRTAGHAPALFAALRDAAPTPRGQAYGWACRLACDVGDEALATIAAPPDGAADDDAGLRSTLFAQVCAARGAISTACQRAAAVAVNDAAPADARLAAVELLLDCRDDDADRRALARITPVTPVDVVRHAASTLCARVAEPRTDVDADDCARAAAELSRAFGALSPSAQHAHAAMVVRALWLVDQPREAAALCARVSFGPGSATSSPSRALLLERGRAALELGALDEALAAFRRASTAGSALARAEARLGAACVRLVQGQLEGFASELAATAAELSEHEVTHAMAGALGHLQASFASLIAREGATPRLSFSPRAARDLSLACVKLAEGDAATALSLARKARGRARDEGRAIAALEALVVCADAALVAGDVSALAAHADQLAAESARVGSRRHALEARFASLVVEASGRAPSADALVLLARATDTNPVVARRAAALLGENAHLDAIDRRVVAALSADAAAAPQVLAQSDGPAWTVDADAMRVLLDDGRVVDLSQRKVLFDLLVVLCRHGGAATKEQLLQAAWGVRDYHPLQHDNRLKVAVRKLRRLLEEALGDDPIQAAEDGYRLRGRVRFLSHERPAR